MKIVVINSTGPMGSTVVSAIVEKFGYLNLPIRDLGMHDYLIGTRAIDDDYLKNKFIGVIYSDSRMLYGGGVNVLDRDNSTSYQRVDKDLVTKDIIEVQQKQFRDLSELYDCLRSIYTKGLKYKKSKHVAGKHIEMTTDFHTYHPDKLCSAYFRGFGDVVFIHLHRDFLGWVESIASQRFSNPRKRHKFFLHKLYRRHFQYESRIKDCPGLHLDFESLFLPNTWQLIDHISEALGEPVPDIQWEDELFDLYGQLRSFSRTFTMADYRGKYLSPTTRRIIKASLGKRNIILIHFFDAIVYFFYLINLLKFLYKKNAYTTSKKSP
jgi:hypothetical protein